MRQTVQHKFNFSSSMDPEYKVGALADLISSKGGDGGGKTLSMASLFTTDKKQKEFVVAPEVSKMKSVKKANKKVKKVKKVKVADSGDVGGEEESKDAKAKTPSAQELVKREDEKEEKQRKRDPEQEERTVFVGNLPVSATKKQVWARRLKYKEYEYIAIKSNK